jgi:hypothetical protein
MKINITVIEIEGTRIDSVKLIKVVTDLTSDSIKLFDEINTILSVLPQSEKEN